MYELVCIKAYDLIFLGMARPELDVNAANRHVEKTTITERQRIVEQLMDEIKVVAEGKEVWAMRHVAA